MEQNRNRGSPRLLFSKEELDNPALSRPAKKAAKAADKYEAAQKKLPTRHRLRLTREEIETGLKKFGAMLGDFVEVGCNSVLNPGTVIGSDSNVYPLSPVRGFVPAESIYKTGGVIVKKQA